MQNIARVILGALIGAFFFWLMVITSATIAARFPKWSDLSPFLLLSAVVIILGVLYSKLFAVRPVLSALAAAAAAILLAIGPFSADIIHSWSFITALLSPVDLGGYFTFLVAPALVAYLIGRRSNNHRSGRES